MSAVLQERAFTTDDCRKVLSAAANILAKWAATTELACKILRVSRSTLARAQSGKPVDLDSDQISRASIILNCHAALKTVFDNPENVYGFVNMKNHNPFFNGKSPLEIMSSGQFVSLYETYKRIDALRGAGW